MGFHIVSAHTRSFPTDDGRVKDVYGRCRPAVTWDSSEWEKWEVTAWRSLGNRGERGCAGGRGGGADQGGEGGREGGCGGDLERCGLVTCYTQSV